MKRRTFDLPLSVRGPLDAFWADAATAGVQMGQGLDWTPSTVDEALFELLLSGSDRVAYADPSTPHYLFRIDASMDEDRFVETAHEDGFWDPRGLEASLVAALGADGSPVDLHFEIIGISETASAHTEMTRRAQLLALFAGDATHTPPSTHHALL